MSYIIAVVGVLFCCFGYYLRVLLVYWLRIVVLGVVIVVCFVVCEGVGDYKLLIFIVVYRFVIACGLLLFVCLLVLFTCDLIGVSLLLLFI